MSITMKMNWQAYNRKTTSQLIKECNRRGIKSIHNNERMDMMKELGMID